jgi:SHS2 domain-containing protein
MPYRFREDIAPADVAVEAWGETLEELFASCAEALLATMVENPDEVARIREVAILLDDDELDLLLFSFLQELIFYKDARRLLLHADKVRIVRKEGGFGLESLVCGEEIDRGRHRLVVDVKAVTLFHLRVVREDSLWKATLVLDV